MTSEEHLEAHRGAGRDLRAGGVGSFVRDEGEGEPAVCLHGVPSSSYLYRKVVAELALRGLRGIAFDFPGLGLAERPAGFDYTWTGLGRWTAAAVDALELERFHLVVHDIGAPAGLELAAERAERVASLTILNSMVCVDGFRKPWVMRPFERKGVGEAYLATMNPFLFTRLMYLLGVEDRAKAPPEELSVYVDLLKREDGGRAFLRIMRGFEPTAAKQRRYVDAIRDLDAPVQLVWGEHDRTLSVDAHARPAMRATGVDTLHLLPAKHFLQEDQAPAVAELIASQAARA